MLKKLFLKIIKCNIQEEKIYDVISEKDELKENFQIKLNNVIQDLMTEKTEKKKLELELKKIKEIEANTQKNLENEIRSLKNVKKTKCPRLFCFFI